jgi:predicted NAD-dependent protein-ADP-ribosyltransferase YbiA (DUF1768 family)
MQKHENFSDHTFQNATLFRQTDKEAAKIGRNVRTMLNKLWAIEYNVSYCNIIKFLKLAKKYSKKRLERACERAIYYNRGDEKTVIMILKNGLDHLSLSEETDVYGQQELVF